jgi:hypothetical protein
MSANCEHWPSLHVTGLIHIVAVFSPCAPLHEKVFGSQGRFGLGAKKTNANGSLELNNLVFLFLCYMHPVVYGYNKVVK